MLAVEENFAGLARINRELIGKADALDAVQRVVLAMDSTEVPVYSNAERFTNPAYRWVALTCKHRILLSTGMFGNLTRRSSALDPDRRRTA